MRTAEQQVNRAAGQQGVRTAWRPGKRVAGLQASQGIMTAGQQFGRDAGQQSGNASGLPGKQGGRAAGQQRGRMASLTGHSGQGSRWKGCRSPKEAGLQGCRAEGIRKAWRPVGWVALLQASQDSRASGQQCYRPRRAAGLRVQGRSAAGLTGPRGFRAKGGKAASLPERQGCRPLRASGLQDSQGSSAASLPGR